MKAFEDVIPAGEKRRRKRDLHTISDGPDPMPCQDFGFLRSQTPHFDILDTLSLYFWCYELELLVDM